MGSGKSTVARGVAEMLGYTYLDSGAMYRALALKANRRGVALSDAAALEKLARETQIDLERGADGQKVLLDGEDVTQAIRTAEVSQAASHVALIPGVRQVLVDEQRRAGSRGGVVMEGRDIGTVVFPHAELKIFLDASVEMRAERRWREHQQKGDGTYARASYGRSARTRFAGSLARSFSSGAREGCSAGGQYGDGCSRNCAADRAACARTRICLDILQK